MPAFRFFSVSCFCIARGLRLREKSPERLEIGRRRRGVPFGNQGCLHGDGAAEEKTQRVFIASGPTQRREFKFNPHRNLPHQYCPESNTAEPQSERRNHYGRGSSVCLSEYTHAHQAINEKSNRTHNHRALFQRGTKLSVFEKGERECCERDRRCRSEQSCGALGFQWPFRRAQDARAGISDSRANTIERDWNRLFPGNSSRKIISRLQPLLSARRVGKADASFGADRHADIGLPGRRQRKYIHKPRN
jgi:hypothetical protein